MMCRYLLLHVVNRFSNFHDFLIENSNHSVSVAVDDLLQMRFQPVVILVHFFNKVDILMLHALTLPMALE